MIKSLCDKSNKKGFTLVELIVVLVILAILAAILVPALMGYIEKAREKEDLTGAENVVVAVQSCLTEEYGRDNGCITTNVNVGNNKKEDRRSIITAAVNNNGDVDAAGTDFAKKVFELAEFKPYVLVVGLGSTDKYYDTDKHKVYTCYYAMYLKDKNSDPIYFDGETWRREYPKEIGIINGQNVLKKSGIKLQFYLLANGDSKKTYTVETTNSVWNYLKGKSKKYLGK